MISRPSEIETAYDVVVAGGGGAGLAAAIEARSLGREVLLIEKSSQLGGSTAWSIGSISASATPHQIRRSIKDCPEDHWRDMAGFNGALDARDNPELRRILAEAMPDTFRWLLHHGIRFYGPMPEPPHKKPRMHNVLPNSRSFIVHLERAARRAGVDIRTSARAASLLHENGRVSGIEYQTAAGTKHLVRARGGVVLASGDFTNDPELKARYMGPLEATVGGVNVHATGDGQKLGLAAGGQVLNGDLALGPELRFIPPPQRSLLLRLPPWPLLANIMAWSFDHMPPTLLRPFIMSFVTTALAPSLSLFEEGALLVNQAGERFCDEREKPAFALPDQPGGVGYILLDRRLSERFSAWPRFVSTAPGVAYAYVADYKRNRPDIFTAGGHLETLSRKLRLPSAALRNTVSAANRAAGNRPHFGHGPYIALGPVQSVFVHAEGGLAVDSSHRVLRSGGEPIPGLYAAGSVGQGGLLLKGHGHHLAWAFASGRRAGRNAAFAAISADTVS
jgi:fumarate reductase flavoprotein subunit